MATTDGIVVLGPVQGKERLDIFGGHRRARSCWCRAAWFTHSRIRDQGRARWLTIFSPSGMEGCFREFAHRGHLYQTASMEEIQALARRFKFEFV